MQYTILSYSLYLPLTVLLTVWVAHTLFRNGRVFLLEIFHGNEPMADSVNKLLIVGFYLVNLGYAVYTMTIAGGVESNREVFEVLSKKIGFIILVLGFWHFFNMYLLFRGKKKSKQNTADRLKLQQMQNDPEKARLL